MAGAGFGLFLNRLSTEIAIALDFLASDSLFTVKANFCRYQSTTWAPFGFGASPSEFVGCDESCAGTSTSFTFPTPTPSISRLVLESGRPTPRHVATSITLPWVIFPITIFWPSGKSMTRGESDNGSGSFETLGADSEFFLLANF